MLNQVSDKLLTMGLELRNGLISCGLFQEQTDEHLFFDRERLGVAHQRQDVLGVVIEVVVPGVLLNFHLSFAIMLHKGLVQIITQLLEVLNRWQEEGSHPCGLIRVHLTGSHFQNRHLLLLPS